jgi:hypothetical protein
LTNEFYEKKRKKTKIITLVYKHTTLLLRSAAKEKCAELWIPCEDSLTARGMNVSTNQF